MTWHGEPRAIFVMNARGELFASTYQKVGLFHHSTLSGGEPVAAAGELIVENGKLVGITNKSGHYMPDSTYTLQALELLRAKNVELRGVTVFDEASGITRTLP